MWRCASEHVVCDSQSEREYTPSMLCKGCYFILFLCKDKDSLMFNVNLSLNKLLHKFKSTVSYWQPAASKSVLNSVSLCMPCKANNTCIGWCDRSLFKCFKNRPIFSHCWNNTSVICLFLSLKLTSVKQKKILAGFVSIQ